METSHPLRYTCFHGSLISASFQKATVSLNAAWLDLVFPVMPGSQYFSRPTARGRTVPGKPLSALHQTQWWEDLWKERQPLLAGPDTWFQIVKKSSPRSDLSRPIFSWSNSTTWASACQCHTIYWQITVSASIGSSLKLQGHLTADLWESFCKWPRRPFSPGDHIHSQVATNLKTSKN